MALYSKIARRMWSDEKFRTLSKLPPSGQSLWIYLLTNPVVGPIPGLYSAGRLMLAETLRWEISDFDAAMAELVEQEMVRFDWEARLIWIPNAMSYNFPESPNVVASWPSWINELPECELRHEAVRSIENQLISNGSTWIDAYRTGENRTARPNQIPRPIATEVRKRDGDCCRYCRIKVNWHDRKGKSGATFDHVDPAGPTTKVNLVVSCRSCNSKKSMRTPEQAGMQLLPVNQGSNERSVDDQLIDQMTITVISNNQEQEQEQEQEKEERASAPEVDAPIPDSDLKVQEIWETYPTANIKPRNGSPRRFEMDAIIEAIIRDGYDLVLAGTRNYRDAVERWPPGEKRYIRPMDKFFSATDSDYAKPPDYWDREHGNEKPRFDDRTKAQRDQDATIAAIAGAKRIVRGMVERAARDAGN